MAELGNVQSRPTLETLEKGAQESHRFASRLLDDLRELHSDLTNRGHGVGSQAEDTPENPGIIIRINDANRDTHDTLAQCREMLDEVRSALLQPRPKKAVAPERALRAEMARVQNHSGE